MDFKYQPDNTIYCDLVRFFLNNFEKLSSLDVTWSVLSHFFLAPVHRRFRGLPKPILWLVGITGDGKSFVVQVAMNLFGDFPEGTEDRRYSWTSSAVFITEMGQYFKDAVFFVDDFKLSNLISMGTRGAQSLIANYFDGTADGKLNRDGTPKKQRTIRGFLIVTGEDIPPVDAATLARTSIVRYPHNQRSIGAGEALKSRQEDFRQIMPQYLKWFLNQDLVRFERYYTTQKNRLFKLLNGAQNDLRIATMAAQSALGFELLSHFLHSLGLLTQDEVAHRERTFTAILEARATSIATLAVEEQGCNAFLRILKSLVQSREVEIVGNLAHISSSDKEGRMIGFISVGEPGAINVIPDLALGAVNRFMAASQSKVAFSKDAIGEQLKSGGHMVNPPKEGCVRRVRSGRALPYVWVLKGEAVGFEPEVEGEAASASDSSALEVDPDFPF